MTLKNTKLMNKLKELCKGSDVLDIILFGSAVRGNEKPNDTDIVVIFEDKIDKEMEYKIRKELEKHFDNVSIISKTSKTVLGESFDARESLLFEGFSLLSLNNISTSRGFTSFGGFKYDFSNWDNNKKTKFYYALNGRNGSIGIFKSLECIKMSDSLVLIPLKNIDKFKDFLESWEIKYKYIPMLIPVRLGRKSILE